MKIEQIYTGCLAQGAYYIYSNGEAAIIDPLREVQPYIERATQDNAKIKYIFETHFHADFVSGHVTLSNKTGAPIVFGPNASTDYDTIIAKDGQQFQIGNVTIKVLHTPGHTLESCVYLLLDEKGKEHAIFSGDTLFLGDVGRPDLSQKGEEMTKEDLAGMLYDSLKNKIMPLADDVIVYPAHGAGSACGKNMMKETVDTLGNQKKMNYALDPSLSKTDFIKEVTSGLLPPPGYFSENAKLNKKGYADVEEIVEKGVVPLSSEQIEFLSKEGDILILDTRHQDAFRDSHIPGSIFIGAKGSFAPWVGALVPDITQKIVIVADTGKEEEIVTRLARVGYDNTLGYLQGGIQSWIDSGRDVDYVSSISPTEFEDLIVAGNTNPILDVRKPGEYQSQHLAKAENFPLDFINTYMPRIKLGKNYFIHCAGGYRSMIAASILKARGYHNIVDIAEGFSGLQKTQIPMTDYICPSEIPQEVLEKQLSKILQ